MHLQLSSGLPPSRLFEKTTCVKPKRIRIFTTSSQAGITPSSPCSAQQKCSPYRSSYSRRVPKKSRIKTYSQAPLFEIPTRHSQPSPRVFQQETRKTQKNTGLPPKGSKRALNAKTCCCCWSAQPWGVLRRGKGQKKDESVGWLVGSLTPFGGETFFFNALYVCTMGDTVKRHCNEFSFLIAPVLA